MHCSALLRWSQLNSTALRKITKKRDKRIGDGSGAAWIREQPQKTSFYANRCAKAERGVGVGIFATTDLDSSHARSPILAELRAIECLSAIDDQGRERGMSWGSESTAESGRAGGAAEYYGMEVNCSICMEHLFKPMAFTPCGHMVCAPCHARLVEATGHGAPCPTCRASSGKATRMRQVNKVRASDDPVRSPTYQRWYTFPPLSRPPPTPSRCHPP